MMKKARFCSQNAMASLKMRFSVTPGMTRMLKMESLSRELSCWKMEKKSATLKTVQLVRGWDAYCNEYSPATVNAVPDGGDSGLTATVTSVEICGLRGSPAPIRASIKFGSLGSRLTLRYVSTCEPYVMVISATVSGRCGGDCGVGSLVRRLLTVT